MNHPWPGYLLLLTVVNMYKRMGKVVIKIFQSSAVTQTVLGGFTIFWLQVSYTLYVPKIMETGWQ